MTKLPKDIMPVIIVAPRMPRTALESRRKQMMYSIITMPMQVSR